MHKCQVPRLWSSQHTVTYFNTPHCSSSHVWCCWLQLAICCTKSRRHKRWWHCQWVFIKFTYLYLFYFCWVVGSRARPIYQSADFIGLLMWFDRPIDLSVSPVQSMSQESMRVHAGPPYWPVSEGPSKCPHHRFLWQRPQSRDHHGNHQLDSPHRAGGAEVSWLCLQFSCMTVIIAWTGTSLSEHKHPPKTLIHSCKNLQC